MVLPDSKAHETIRNCNPNHIHYSITLKSPSSKRLTNHKRKKLKNTKESFRNPII